MPDGAQQDEREATPVQVSGARAQSFTRVRAAAAARGGLLDDAFVRSCLQKWCARTRGAVSA